MAKFVFLTIITFLGMSSVARAAFTCNATTDCANSGIIGAFVPDPDDCEKYYGCIQLPDGSIAPTTTSISCLSGNYFNQLSQDCIAEKTTGVCPNACHPKVCPTVCPIDQVQVSYIADRIDCSVYYACTRTGPIRGTCSGSTPYFNGNTCVSDSAQCCDVCNPYCSHAGIQMQDPHDCRSYYLCYGNGQPSESARNTCPLLNYYNETTATCDSGSCNSFCP